MAYLVYDSSQGKLDAFRDRNKTYHRLETELSTELDNDALADPDNAAPQEAGMEFGDAIDTDLTAPMKLQITFENGEEVEKRPVGRMVSSVATRLAVWKIAAAMDRAEHAPLQTSLLLMLHRQPIDGLKPDANPTDALQKLVKRLHMSGGAQPES